MSYVYALYTVAILATRAWGLTGSRSFPTNRCAEMGGRAKGRGGRGGRQHRLPALHYGLPRPAAATSASSSGPRALGPSSTPSASSSGPPSW
eukprot:2008690-Heterocapsa_arctica.AAC.1